MQGTTLTGMNKKPVNEAARHANMLKAINHLRTVPNMSRRGQHVQKMRVMSGKLGVHAGALIVGVSV
eukprot:scaffold39669_cov24-Tisochrysis_lutea.AAC.1